MMLTKILAAGCLACVLADPCSARQGPPGSLIPPQADPNCVAVGERKIKPADLAQGDIYAAAMAVDGNVALVASEWDDDQGKDSGAVFVYRCDGRQWVEEQKLLPSDGQAGDNFGRSLELDGNLAVVGTHWDDDNGEKSGSVYAFRYNGAAWVQEQKLLASDGKADDRLGNTVSVDGDVIVAGAWKKNGGGKNSGAAYVYRFNGLQWVQEQKLVASDREAYDGFGRHVSVSGNVIAVGTWQDDDGASNGGAVYMFRHTGTSWVQEQKLVASDAGTNSFLGWSVYLDGRTVVAGAYGDSPKGTQSGAAYVWRYDGASWSHEHKIVPRDGSAYDYFGFSIALDGDNLAVGAYVKLTEFLGPGAVYLYRYRNNEWSKFRKIVPSDGAPQDAFGFHVALKGKLLVTGSWRDDDAGADSGSAYLYTFPDL